MLLGKRHAKSTFLPEYYVFPGGKVDAADSRATGLQVAPGVAAGLARGTRRPAHAFMQAAMRETAEETGLVFPAAYAPSLDYICQAITPTRLPRRYNTRFFLGAADECDNIALQSNGELDDLAWRAVDHLDEIRLLAISRIVLAEALERRRQPRPPGEQPALRVTYIGERERISRPKR